MKTFSMSPPGFVELTKEEIENAIKAAEVCKPLWTAVTYQELERMVVEVADDMKQKRGNSISKNCSRITIPESEQIDTKEPVVSGYVDWEDDPDLPPAPPLEMVKETLEE